MRIAPGRSVLSHGEVFEVISPHTEDPIAHVAAAGAADVETAVSAARAALDFFNDTATTFIFSILFGVSVVYEMLIVDMSTCP
ncbi:aldehyde dehydrogenase family protein, partial [Mycobacterium sp. 852002-53434_SCH5985345]|uniref:aldehyde dehydrogenase family protein n=1 Tax=Mycobacterium sp. 852002-53434_SCH5985345 TaxID=1834107 RepID=UPI0026F44B21